MSGKQETVADYHCHGPCDSIVAICYYVHTHALQFSFLDRRHFEMISLGFIHSYKDVYRWWAPFELVRRYIFLVAVIFTPGYLV